MDSKEIKASLKQAREAIKEKDFKSVLKHCKNVFKLDQNNYNAWVFVGVAAQETGQLDQAVSAYKKAIGISPDEILAWQGLCSFCEKQASEDYQDDLMNAYTKLIEFYNSDKAKQHEILTKLLSLSKSTGKTAKIIEAMKLHLDLVKGDPDEEYSVWKGIFQELLKEDDGDSSYDSLRETACEELLLHNKSSEDGCPAMCASYVKRLLKCGQKETAMKLANQIYSRFPDDMFSLELLCRVVLDVYISTGVVANISDDALLRARSQLKSGIGCIVQGITGLSARNYAQAIQDLKEGLERSPSCLEAWLILCKTQLKLHRYEDAETSAKGGLRCAVQNGASNEMLGKFYLLLGKALSGRRNYDTAMKVLEKSVDCSGRTSEMLTTFTFTLLNIGQLENAEKVCDELLSTFDSSSEILQLQGYLCIKQKKYSDALLNLKKAMALEESAFSLHLVALTLWEMNEHEKAFKMFLKATESDPYNPRNFLYLGHYYKNKNELRKAVRCYQRAFSLDNFDEDIALSLSTTLKTLGDQEENYALLKFVTKKSSLGRFQWAWIQLGLYQLERNDALNAVFSIQTAIRSDPNNSHLWECLGDAYFMRGSHESALKAFENASNLEPKALYPLYQVSTIQKLRGLYLDAIEKFKNVLSLDPSYVPALIGLAETYVLLAKKAFGECVYGQTKYCCQEALYSLSKVVDTTMGLSCLWKLAGDACTLPFHLEDNAFPITVPGKLNIGCSSEEDIFCKRKLLEFGAKFYGQSLSLQGNVSTLWHDLGVNCYFQSLMCNSNESQNFASKALLCFQKAVSVSPTYHAHWNSLGVVSVSKDLQDFALAQHAFIKSIEVERINAEAWASLGVLYLVNNNVELAHNALSIAQSLEPSYPLSWVSQAIIADSVEHIETMDLFRHATTLGSHPEALLGYGRMVCRTLMESTNKNAEQYKYNIVQMDAVVVAADCMIKYTANVEDNPEAFNMLGMLLERLGMLNGSLKAYKRSVELMTDNGTTEDIERVRANYARLLSCAGHPKEAIEQFLMLKNADTALLCSFGFALYKDMQLREAFKALQRALQVSKKPTEKSHILVAMAMVGLSMKDPNAPNPLKLLLESSQMKPPSVLGLLALCAVGIMKREASLTFAALKELHPLKPHPEYSPSVGFLSAACHYQTDKKKAFRELLKAVHNHPGNSNMWMQLASSLLLWDPQNAHLASGCAVIAIHHQGDKEIGTQILALCQLTCGYRKVALRAAQKALHTRPDKLANWTTLAAACHVAEVNREHVGWLFSFVKKLAKEQGISSDLLSWLIIMEIFHFIHFKDLSSANNIISTVSHALEKSSVNPVLQVLDAIAKVQSNNGKLDALVLSLKKNPGIFLGWQTLVQLLIRTGKFPEAEKTLKQFSVAAKTYFPKWECFPVLQLAVLSYQAMHTPGINKATWLPLAEESVSEAVKSLPTSKACRLMQGLIALESGNMSLARRSFEHVLNRYNSEEPKWMDKVARHSVVSCYMEKNDVKAITKLVDQFPEDEELHCVYEKLTSVKKKDYFDCEDDV